MNLSLHNIIFSMKRKVICLIRSKRLYVVEIHLIFLVLLLVAIFIAAIFNSYIDFDECERRKKTMQLYQFFE